MMNLVSRTSVLLVLLVSIVVVVVNSAPSSPYAAFLKLNANPSGLPLSYYVPPTYFPSIPESERPHDHTKPEIVASCNYELVPPANLDAYEFQTEQFLSTLGLNLYDGACWSIAQSILGNTGVVQQYMQNTLLEHKTLQFGDIKADRPCQGQLEPYGNCTDPAQNGNCGFCYGSNLVSLPTSQAYFFRMISDYWCLLGTVDARCPQLDHLWCWNDYSPITGENSWANLIGTIQTEYITAGGNVNNIPDSSPAMQLATSFLTAVSVMTLPNGAVYYAPYNTYSENTPDVGATVSVENNVSLLAGLKMLYAVISQKQSSSYKSLLPQIQSSINGITNFLRTSYEPELGFFRQGGRYNRTTGAWTWTNFPFAADCQTWALAVLGPSVVDGWFGAGTSLNIWNVTKAISGYNYNRATGWVDGVGFSDNVKDQVFSGEWTLGAVNMLRVIAEASNSSVASSLQAEATHMRQAVSAQLTSTFTYPTGESATAIIYANKRYYIPFGWWANPLPSMASSGWAVMTDNNFNPFYLGGAYKS